MQLLTPTLFLLATLLPYTTAKPLPISFNDVERRWASGDSEQQIRSGVSIRDMTPAWPIARSNEDGSSAAFSAVLDERTMLVRDALQSRGSTVVWDLVAERFGGRKTGAVEAPVVRPRKEMRYYFSS